VSREYTPSNTKINPEKRNPTVAGAGSESEAESRLNTETVVRAYLGVKSQSKARAHAGVNSRTGVRP
jgi:hypothetical protein